MSRATGSKISVNERRRTTSDNTALETSDQHDNQQQQQEDPSDKSPLPSGRTSELKDTDRKKQESGESERDAEKMKKIQKKVIQQMVLGRLRQAIRQQDEQLIKNELDNINANYKEELGGSDIVEDANELLLILNTAKELKEYCDEKDVVKLEKAIKEIEEKTKQKIKENNDKRWQEMLLLPVREAKYVLEWLKKKQPVRRSGGLHMDAHSFNELRRYARPPPGVLPTMKAVFLLLNVDESRTETWPDIQRLCKPSGKKNLYYRVLNLKIENVQPELAARAREIIGEDKQTKQKEKPKPENDEESYETEESRDQEAENNGELETADNDGKHKHSAITSREPNKEQDPETKSIDRKKLRTTCPVAYTLLLWALDVVTQVEEIHGEEKMVPANVKRQQEILGLRLPRLPKMDRQYYRILAKNSLARSYHQEHGTGLYGGQPYRNTFPPTSRYPEPRHRYYESLSPRRPDDDNDAVHLRGWRAGGVHRDYLRSRDPWDRWDRDY